MIFSLETILGLGVGTDLIWLIWIERNCCFVFDEKVHSLSPARLEQGRL